MAQLFEVDIALVGDFTGGIHIVFHLAVFVADGFEAQLNIFVNAELGEYSMLTDVELFAAAAQVLVFDESRIENLGLEEPSLGLLIDLAELAHVVVHIDEVALAVVECHGDDVGLKDLHVFCAELAVDALVFDLLGNITGGVGDITRLEVHIFKACQSADPDPVWIFQRTDVQAFGVARLLEFSRDQQIDFLLEVFLVALVDAGQEDFPYQLTFGQQLTVDVVDLA